MLTQGPFITEVLGLQLLIMFFDKICNKVIWASNCFWVMRYFLCTIDTKNWCFILYICSYFYHEGHKNFIFNMITYKYFSFPMKISHRARRVTKKKKSLTLKKKVKYPTHDVTIATKILFVTIGSRRTLPTIWNWAIFWFWQDLLKKQSCIPFLLKRLLALLPDKIKVTHRNLKQVSLNCQVFW